MKPRISVLTIGVDSLERSLAFYRDGLGLDTQGIVGTEFEHSAVVFMAQAEQAGARIVKPAGPTFWGEDDLDVVVSEC